jgi:hypothetical protein
MSNDWATPTPLPDKCVRITSGGVGERLKLLKPAVLKNKNSQFAKLLKIQLNPFASGNIATTSVF